MTQQALETTKAVETCPLALHYTLHFVSVFHLMASSNVTWFSFKVNVLTDRIVPFVFLKRHLNKCDSERALVKHTLSQFVLSIYCWDEICMLLSGELHAHSTQHIITFHRDNSACVTFSVCNQHFVDPNLQVSQDSGCFHTMKKSLNAHYLFLIWMPVCFL